MIPADTVAGTDTGCFFALMQHGVWAILQRPRECQIRFQGKVESEAGVEQGRTKTQNVWGGTPAEIAKRPGV